MPNLEEFSVTVDTTKLNEALASLNDALIGNGQDASNILRQEHKNLTRTIVNFTPPLPKASARQAGERAVEGDLKSLIAEANPKLIDSLSSEYGTENIDAYRMSKGGEPTHYLWDRIVLNPGDLPAVHASYRNSRGRVRRQRGSLGKGVWSSRVVVPQGMRANYIAEIKSHVGRWKAKWAYGAAQLGDRFPNWISRHFPHVGSKAVFEANLEYGGNNFIRFGGSGPNFRQNLGHIRGAVKFRAEVIARRIKLVVSGYAKDIAQGIKARARAHRDDGFSEDVD